MTAYSFKEGTKQAKLYQVLSDMEWHCGKHELPGTQPAKAIQILKQYGFEIEKATKYCPVCKEKTVHRRLISTEPVKPSFTRIQIPGKLRKRILEYYRNTEAISLRKLKSNELEVDHRFPQVRWSRDEFFNLDMSDEDIHKKFQLLTRQNNLWKSRYCERCQKTGERGTFIDIDYFYAGNEHWDSQFPSDDERGCLGCFWYNVEEWRNHLNALLQDAD